MSVFDEDLTPDEEARLGPTVKLMRALYGVKNVPRTITDPSQANVPTDAQRAAYGTPQVGMPSFVPPPQEPTTEDDWLPKAGTYTVPPAPESMTQDNFTPRNHSYGFRLAKPTPVPLPPSPPWAATSPPGMDFPTDVPPPSYEGPRTDAGNPSSALRQALGYYQKTISTPSEADVYGPPVPPQPPRTITTPSAATEPPKTPTDRPSWAANWSGRRDEFGNPIVPGAMQDQKARLVAEDAANGRPGGLVSILSAPAGVDQWRPDAHTYQSVLDKQAAANQGTLAKAQAMAQMEHEETGVPLAQTKGQSLIDMFRFNETRNRVAPGMSQADVAGVIDAASKQDTEAKQLDDAKKAAELKKLEIAKGQPTWEEQQAAEAKKEQDRREWVAKGEIRKANAEEEKNKKAIWTEWGKRKWAATRDKQAQDARADLEQQSEDHADAAATAQHGRRLEIIGKEIAGRKDIAKMTGEQAAERQAKGAAYAKDLATYRESLEEKLVGLRARLASEQAIANNEAAWKRTQAKIDATEKIAARTDETRNRLAHEQQDFLNWQRTEREKHDFEKQAIGQSYDKWRTNFNADRTDARQDKSIAAGEANQQRAFDQAAATAKSKFWGNVAAVGAWKLGDYLMGKTPAQQHEYRVEEQTARRNWAAQQHAEDLKVQAERFTARGDAESAKQANDQARYLEALILKANKMGVPLEDVFAAAEKNYPRQAGIPTAAGAQQQPAGSPISQVGAGQGVSVGAPAKPSSLIDRMTRRVMHPVDTAYEDLVNLFGS